jgi:hypothetical protein
MKLKILTLLFAAFTMCALQANANDLRLAAETNNESKQVQLTSPGTLQELLEAQTDNPTSLTVTGTVNSRDLAYLNSGTGKMANVTELDLSAVKLHYDGECYASHTLQMAGFYNYGIEANFYLSSESARDTTRYSSGSFPSTTTIVYHIYGHDLAGAFAGNQTLKKVVLPNGLAAVGDYMFCQSVVEQVDIPDSVREIGDKAFQACSSLTDIHWPLHLKRVGQMAFYSCQQLSVVSLPEGVTEIGGQAFFLCDALHSFYIPSTVQTFGTGGSYSNIVAVTLDKITTITCTSPTPPPVGCFYLSSRTVAKVRVPAENFEDYKTSPNWQPVADVIEPIEEISAASGSSTTVFATSGLQESSDLSDTVLGNIYFTLSDNDAYRADDGSITVVSTMDADKMNDIGGMVPRFSDLSYRYTGLVLTVGAGECNVSLDCETAGSRCIGVKIGTGATVTYTQSDRGTITVNYNVTEPTCIYICGMEQSTVQTTTQHGISAAAENDGCVKIYALSTQYATDISAIHTIEGATVVNYYDLSGKRIAMPKKGANIVKYPDGTVKKIFY